MKTYPIKARIRAQGESTRVDIFDDIGADPFFGGGISAADFSGELATLRGPLDVHISSYGGDVSAGLAMYNTLKSYRGPVTTYNDGIAASIASVIMQAGARRVTADSSVMMLHDAWGAAQGNEADMQEMAEALRANSDAIARAYAQGAGGSPAQWREVMRATTWYDADQALAAGLVDEIGGVVRPGGVDLGELAAVAPARIMARLRAAADDGSDAPACKTCGGNGRLKHPGTGKAGIKCPGCDGTGTYDPDGDGDDDESATGDTDHDYVTPDGHAVGVRLQDPVWAVYRLAVRDSGGSVDSSPWDGPKAMSNGANADDPAAFYKGICAGRREGDADKQSSWALPYKYHPSDPPNAAGVKAALGRLSQTEGLTNAGEAKTTLEKAMKQVNPDYEPSDRLDIDFSAMGAEIAKAAKEAFK